MIMMIVVVSESVACDFPLQIVAVHAQPAAPGSTAAHAGYEPMVLAISDTRDP
jgi:hypothetical protein